VVRAVTSIAEQGMAVILGRGAPFVLRPERTLRVLVVAPRRARIERLAKERDLPVDEAERRMRREDEERRTFLTQFGVDPDDPSIYDLVVNTGSLGMDGATHTVVQTFRDRHPGA
jgi:cytidylate kinase